MNKYVEISMPKNKEDIDNNRLILKSNISRCNPKMIFMLT